MLFNSYEFIFWFLVPVGSLFFFVPQRLKLHYLSLASIVFYAQWSVWHLTLLLGSVAINYLYVLSIEKKQGKKLYLFGIILLNLIPLIYYKYSNFLTLHDSSIVLPLAISFFTFQQIAFVVDIYRGRIKLVKFSEYSFFILFFPQLIAGPIVHYNEMITQVRDGVLDSFSSAKFKAGITLFSIGLFSKVVLADNLIQSSYESWGNLFSYSFMIYFDFSGYANMAIGLALIFGISLPINFNSPYKSRNLVDFWRRWHITLSSFLKDHIYIPLGGNRFGKKREIIAILVTMLIGGIWHGAGWNFMLWGLMHGFGIVVLHLINIKLPKPLSIFLTFLYVSLLWVLFLSGDMGEAIGIYKELFSFESFRIQLYDGVFLLFCAWIVWFVPNSTEIIKLDGEYKLKWWHGYLSGALLFISLKFMAVEPSTSFVYFNF
jgi:D-alanyl-lipoteichoic acid acyltransferase DltB (MBOAT superfamily)